MEEVEFRGQLFDALGDGYELGELIGEGGFGRVYKARDSRLDRAIAIKVIRPELAGAKAFLRRFKREGVALARLRHPGIVPIYDIREANGLIYYVMPFIEGENLRVKLERGRMAPKEAQRILSELCDSVAASHRAGIIHRDIKPDNVILEGFLGKVLLMDFGIAKGMDEAHTTSTGVIIGTPTYMSPEQAFGEKAIDHRSDIYSLGVLGYHMLMGKPPFVGKTLQEIIVQYTTQTPTPIRRVNPSVPKLLADTIERCLQRDPADRFDSAMEVWGQLQRVTFSPTKREAKNIEIPRNSYLFGALAIMSLLMAAAGDDPLDGFSRVHFLILGALFATLSALLLPAVRHAITSAPSVRESMKTLIARLKRRDWAEYVEYDHTPDDPQGEPPAGEVQEPSAANEDR